MNKLLASLMKMFTISCFILSIPIAFFDLDVSTHLVVLAILTHEIFVYLKDKEKENK